MPPVLPLLAPLGALISGSADLKKTLGILLQIMSREMGVVRGMVTLYHRRTGKPLVHEGLGLSDEEVERGVYHRGEGIAAKVLALGRPVVEDLRSQSLICVPILRGGKVLGTIGVERTNDTAERLQQAVDLLSLVAGMVAQEAEQSFLEEENRRLRDELKVRYHPSNIIGDSPAMRQVYHLVEKVSKTRTTVLIVGESGVGKELIASAIHYASLQAAGPFVKINCAALPETLDDLFSAAQGGTLFLDEVGELPPTLQAKLLGVLQGQGPEGRGGTRSNPIEVRVLASTSGNLEALAAQGQFRRDLCYRLNGFPITVPALRDRGADVLTLADHFLARASRQTGKVVRGLATPALNLLMAHPWPGNVRELENCLERALILTDGDFIHAHHLPPSLHASEAAAPPSTGPSVAGLAPGTSLEDHLASIEKSYLVRTLEETRGNMAEAARRLGLTKRMMLLRMEKFQLDYTVFRR